MQSMHGCDPSNGTGMYEKSARTVNQDALGGEAQITYSSEEMSTEINKVMQSVEVLQNTMNEFQV